MSAHVYPATDWFRARAARASTGRSPRLAVIRSLVLRQTIGGQWSVALMERRYGVWKKPDWLYVGASHDEAKAVVSQAWCKHRLPVAYVRPGERHMRPFHINQLDSIGDAA
ncbi:hypothetical protein [Sphingomonas qomolangmaensis]|uniref:Uncharacterized protein n=1 Tax=Sphingomonas qomolangmaensis TaxID=2918765 RepID=A0ABY5LCJ3_9SPHN|nr:hypothetical protein [Sphingomonas qomolangmaensis]UUL83444.1 hypothetical protein NMP03_04235 [Sphingomonas qomolangmaensis]